MVADQQQLELIGMCESNVVLADLQQQELIGSCGYDVLVEDSELKGQQELIGSCGVFGNDMLEVDPSRGTKMMTGMNGMILTNVLLEDSDLGTQTEMSTVKDGDGDGMIGANVLVEDPDEGSKTRDACVQMIGTDVLVMTTVKTTDPDVLGVVEDALEMRKMNYGSGDDRKETKTTKADECRMVEGAKPLGILEEHENDDEGVEVEQRRIQSNLLLKTISSHKRQGTITYFCKSKSSVGGAMVAITGGGENDGGKMVDLKQLKSTMKLKNISKSKRTKFKKTRPKTKGKMGAKSFAGEEPGQAKSASSQSRIGDYFGNETSRGSWKPLGSSHRSINTCLE